MSATIIVCSVIAAGSVGLWFGYYANREVRREAAKKRLEEAQRAHAEAERGREVNRFNNLKLDVYAILTEIVQDPEVLRGRRNYPYPASSVREFDHLRRFLTAHKDFAQGLDRMKYVADGALAAANERRAIIETQKDIQKALGMGQPVEQ